MLVPVKNVNNIKFLEEQTVFKTALEKIVIWYNDTGFTLAKNGLIKRKYQFFFDT